MAFHGGGSGGVVLPAFLTKLWTLVEDPESDPLISWSPNGTSFHVFDQGRFCKEVLPKLFKHKNMASFIRQLNIYGFRKVVHKHGALVKQELDDTEYKHRCFIRGRDQLLKNIKRNVANVSNLKQDELKVFPEEVSKILSDVQLMKGKQENIQAYCISMKHENEALRRELASLKLAMKRKIPLMLNDSTSAHSMPKYSQQYSLEPLQSSQAISASSGGFSAASLCPADSPLNSGSIDYGLENLPYIQSINFDSSPLCEFSALFPVETDLDSPDILLSPEPAKGTDGGNYSSNTRKQLVTTEPMCLGQADLPSLLGQEVDSYFTLVNM